MADNITGAQLYTDLYEAWAADFETPEPVVDSYGLTTAEQKVKTLSLALLLGGSDPRPIQQLSAKARDDVLRDKEIVAFIEPEDFHD